ncbi:MAG: DUF5638 domain-containing protein [Legionella sp.]
MPYNHRRIELRLRALDKRLQALFADQEQLDIQIRTKIKRQIKEIQEYYNLSYEKASSAKRVVQILNSYNSFINQLEAVKRGDLDAKSAIENIGSATESRKINVLLHNLCKAAEAVFWAATALTLAASIFGIALPMLIVQPALGVAVGITIVGAMLYTGYKCLSALTEFRAMSRHDSEYNSEVGLISSFFKPPRKEPQHEMNEPLEHAAEYSWLVPI